MTTQWIWNNLLLWSWYGRVEPDSDIVLLQCVLCPHTIRVPLACFKIQTHYHWSCLVQWCTSSKMVQDWALMHSLVFLNALVCSPCLVFRLWEDTESLEIPVLCLHMSTGPRKGCQIRQPASLPIAKDGATSRNGQLELIRELPVKTN